MSKSPTPKASPPKVDQPWPRLLRIAPKTVLGAVIVWLALAWGIFLTIDILGWFSPELHRPVWTFLFNDRPVEWTQWFLLALAAGVSGYLGGRLDAAGERRAGRFFLLLAIGLGLMLIEDAGDIRHVLSHEVGRLFGTEILGLRHNFWVEAPYFLALASVPIYAVGRYGREAWRATRARAYLASGVLLYALAAGGSLFSNLFHSYVAVGSFFDSVFLGGRLPLLPGRSQGYTHFLFTDSVLEESIELLAIALLLAGILAFAAEFRRRALTPKKVTKPKLLG